MISGVYEIANTVTGHRYIGSSRNVQARQKAHFNYLRRGEHTNQHLQRAYDKYGVDAFSFRVLAACDVDSLIQQEQDLIDALRPEYNIRKIAHCNAGLTASQETRRKMSVAQTGRKHTDEAKRKVSEAQRGKPESEDAKEKNRQWHLGRDTWMKGKHHTAEANEKNRQAHIGRKSSEETRAKQSASLKKRQLSEDQKEWLRNREFTPLHRAKISDALKGRPLSEETKAKLSEAHKGNTPSDETRKKMSEAQRARWAQRKADGQRTD